MRFRVHGVRFRVVRVVRVLGNGVQDLWFRVQGSGVRGLGNSHGLQNKGFRV